MNIVGNVDDEILFYLLHDKFPLGVPYKGFSKDDYLKVTNSLKHEIK